MVGILLLIMISAGMLTFFIGWHLLIINRGRTTNEQMKYNEITCLLQNKIAFCDLWHKKRIQAGNGGKSQPPNASAIEKYKIDKNWNNLEIEACLKQTERDLDSLESNIHNEGFLLNLRAILFP